MDEILRILRERYQLTQLYIRADFSSPAQAPFFFICVADSYHSRVMPRPETYSISCMYVSTK